MKMISITGSSSAGKTSVACALAKAYAKKGSRILVVFTDDLIPPFAYLIPANTIKKEQVLSLGSLLSDYDVTQSKIWKSTCTVMDGKVALLGYLKSDAPDTYPALTDYCVESFLAQLLQVDVDLVIWDFSNAKNMLFDRVAALSPYTVSVLRALPKDYLWAVRNDGFNVDVVVLNAVIRGQEVSIPDVPSSKIHCLPWSDSVDENMNSMDAFGNVDRKYTAAIEKFVSKLDLDIPRS